MKEFATLVNCMDGRVQIPAIQYIKEKYNVLYVDVITLPGPDKVLAENNEKEKIELIKRYIDISISKHGSKLIGIAGHYDCAGNPVDEKTHIEHIKKAISFLKSLYPEIEIIGLWINKEWRVKEIE
jgi:beta-galactosidase beta subunit